MGCGVKCRGRDFLSAEVMVVERASLRVRAREMKQQGVARGTSRRLRARLLGGPTSTAEWHNHVAGWCGRQAPAKR